MMTDSSQVNETTVERAKRRIARMSRAELLDWADTAIAGMQRHLEEYRRTRDEAHMGELEIAETNLCLVLFELMDRQKQARDPGT